MERLDERFEGIKKRHGYDESKILGYGKNPVEDTDDTTFLIFLADQRLNYKKLMAFRHKKREEFYNYMQNSSYGRPGQSYDDVAIEAIEQLENELNDWKKDSKLWGEKYIEEKERADRYKQILEFYADERNYKRPVIDTNDATYLGFSPTEKDKGEKARKALKGVERDGRNRKD
ncbi:hypothetical protein [Virgibacillus salexigens]|uniref:Uncharacterized protein n=1 Tax=Virgibacillus kapii TaxID=1638645 RepID=A0ABQ2DKR4_9BACI|nr:hypothetical protein [Virgibacillus kapii]GGJ61868.1 hypothetical protein GCM10007111_24940 [Virgibacillus kapii]